MVRRVQPIKSIKYRARNLWRKHRPRRPGPIEKGWMTIGHGSYCAEGANVFRTPGDTEIVTVGRFTSIAAEVTFMPGANHHVDWVTTSPIHLLIDGIDRNVSHPWSRGPIMVGNDVWIGRGASILSGVTIGDGAVVGAYSVVTRDVPPYAIVAGSPATVKRYRFDDDLIAGLLAVRWWDWSDDILRECAGELLSANVDAFVRKYSDRWTP
jgi:acetyltransferase-like isoleucine patch superfamily enzyme